MTNGTTGGTTDRTPGGTVATGRAPSRIHGSTLWALITRRAADSPDHEAFADEDGRSFSFGALRDASEAVAAGFRDLGIGRDVRVGWQLPNSLEAVVVSCALSRLEAVQCPIVAIFREREVTYIVESLRAEVLIVPGLWRNYDYGALANAVAVTTGCRPLVTSDFEATSNRWGLALPTGDRSALPPPPTERTPDDSPVRWVFTTSGTTSAPKLVKHTDPTVIATALHFDGGLRLGPDDVNVATAPISHIGGMMLLCGMLQSGFKTLLVRQFDPLTTPQLSAAHGMTVARGAPPVLRAYVDAQLAHGSAPLFPRLRGFHCGGSSRPADVHEAAKTVFGLTGATSSYGMTECAGIGACPLDAPEEQMRTTSGKVLTDCTARVVRSDGTECAPGEEGEIRVKGPMLFKGYVDSSLDADALDELGFFRSGDLGTVDADGWMRITGRIKDIIIRNGENLSALEIENVLSLHPSIADVAVIGMPDTRTGERACAVVALAPGVEIITLLDVIRHCEQQGIARQKFPEQLEIVDEVPRNAMGKLEKQTLRTRYAVVR